MSCTSPASTPPWIAAPTATTSSGLTPLWGSLPPNSSLTTSCTLGMRVEPPTSTTSSIFVGSSLASLSAWLHRALDALDQRVDQLLELGSRDRHLQVLRTVGVGRDERQIDVGRLGGAELLLGLFAGLLQPLQGHRVLAEVDALLFLELVGHVVDQHFVEVVAAEVRVAVGGDHAEHAVGHFEDRDVERAAAEVEHADRFLALLVEAVGQRGGGRLVDDAGDFQAGDLAGVFGGLALGVVEVGRHGDHGLVDLVTQIGLGRLLELAENLGRDLRRRIFLVADLDLYIVLRSADDLVGHHLLFGGDFVVPAAHEPLDRVDGPRRVGHRLPPRGLADQDVALVGERDDARREAVAFGIRDHLRFFAFHHGHDRVGGAQVDADNFFTCCHGWLLLYLAIAFVRSSR